VEGHHSSGLDVAELVSASGGVSVSVKEFGHVGSVLREVRVVKALIPLLVVVNNVVGLLGEQLAQSLVLEDGVKYPDLIDGWLSTLVSDSSSSGETEEGEVDLPEEGLVGHHEGETGPSDEGTSPAIVGSVKSLRDLVKIVSSAHSPFPVVVLEDIVAVLELRWVSLGFVTVFRIGSVEVGPPVVVHIIVALRRSKSHVVVARGSIASEISRRLLHKGLVYELNGLLALHL